jgi:hypothetical protein
MYAIKKENKEKVLKIRPDCPERSGIYFFLREEDGFRFAYIGKAKRLLSRIADHLQGYTQHIDRSLKKHGLVEEEVEKGWHLYFLEFAESELDEKEQHYIKIYANAGYQLYNVESGGNKGKTDIGERKPAKKYYDGVEQGKKNARLFVKHLFDLHLNYVPKKEPPTKLQEKAIEKFKAFLDGDGDG